MVGYGAAGASPPCEAWRSCKPGFGPRLPAVGLETKGGVCTLCLPQPAPTGLTRSTSLALERSAGGFPPPAQDERAPKHGAGGSPRDERARHGPSDSRCVPSRQPRCGRRWAASGWQSAGMSPAVTHHHHRPGTGEGFGAAPSSSRTPNPCGGGGGGTGATRGGILWAWRSHPHPEEERAGGPPSPRQWVTGSGVPASGCGGDKRCRGTLRANGAGRLQCSGGMLGLPRYPAASPLGGRSRRFQAGEPEVAMCCRCPPAQEEPGDAPAAWDSRDRTGAIPVPP